MAKFQITTYPAKQGDRSTGIVITNPINRIEIDCKLDELPRHLEQAAQNVTSPMADHPDVHAFASPVGRAPNGFKAFSAERKDRYTQVNQ